MLPNVDGRRYTCVLLVCTACVLAQSSLGVAQTVGDATGTIDGTITDRTGGAVPDVRVRISSPALMRAREDVSREDGYYRFPALAPGEYLLTFARANFREATHSQIRVAPGSTTSLSVMLDITGLEESVTVAGGARLVDPHGTAVAVVLNAELLDLLPGARAPGAILSIAPAVQLTSIDVGGHTALNLRPFSAYGLAGFSRPTLEGISISQHNRYGFNLDYGSFEEVSVGLGAYGPDLPTPGLHMRIITKSGSNRYRGTLYSAYADAHWQAHNIDDDQIARGAVSAVGFSPRDANRLHRAHDLNADLGGYFRKDHAWWYVSVRDQQTGARQVAFPVGRVESRATSVSFKSTIRVGTASQVVLFANPGITRQPTQLGAFLRPTTAIHLAAESTARQTSSGMVWKAEWNAALGRRLFAEARVGQFEVHREETPNGDAPRFEDLAEAVVSGGNRTWREGLQRDQVIGVFSYFADGPRGRHHLKAGVEIDRTRATETWQRGFAGDVLHVLRNGSPAEVYLFQTPSRSEAGQFWTTAFLHDSWQVHDRLTINAGARYDRFRIFLPEQHHPAGRFNATAQTFGAVDNVIDWNVVSPRAGVSVDLGGDGRTLVKGSYGRYWLPPTTDLAFNVNPNARVWWERFTWSDASQDGLFQPGEQVGEPLERRGGVALESIDPRLELAYINELTGRLERELAAGVSVTSGFIWRGERRQGLRQLSNADFDAFTVATTLYDAGPNESTLLPSGVGPALQLYDLPPDPTGPPALVVRNVARSNGDYLTWDVTVARRLSGRWSLTASFAHSWNRDHEAAYFGQPVRANEYPVTPNDLLHTDAGGRHVFRVWSANLLGSWEGPWGVRLTPLLRHQSGQPFGRTVLARLNYGTIRLLAEPIGSRRQDHLTMIDLGVQKDCTDRRPRAGVRIRRDVQPAQRQSRTEHELGVGSHVPPSAHDRSSANRAYRHEDELVACRSGQSHPRPERGDTRVTPQHRHLRTTHPGGGAPPVQPCRPFERSECAVASPRPAYTSI